VSPRLVLKIKADLRKSVKDDEFLCGWLEQRTGNAWHEFKLALQALVVLSQNAQTININHVD